MRPCHEPERPAMERGRGGAPACPERRPARNVTVRKAAMASRTCSGAELHGLERALLGGRGRYIGCQLPCRFGRFCGESCELREAQHREDGERRPDSLQGSQTTVYRNYIFR